MLTSRIIIRNVYSRFYKVNKNSCNSCGICIESCPCNNIRFNKKGYPEWGKDCIFCWHCELRCPKEAIKSPAEWKAFNPIIKKTLSEAEKDPNIDIQNIDYTNGKIRRK